MGQESGRSGIATRVGLETSTNRIIMGLHSTGIPYRVIYNIGEYRKIFVGWAATI